MLLGDNQNESIEFQDFKCGNTRKSDLINGKNINEML